ncbi:MAG: radical SAM protein [Candidatus Lokiarchaeota archaeon]|nr:radical SAM protein [Candidatus Lokiarchaeota archaeon]
MTMEPNLEGKKLYRRTKSVCPECLKQIDANLVLDELEGKDAVLMRKKCSEHGYFEDIISRNPQEYERNQQYYHDYCTIENKKHGERSGKNCPHECGMCDAHKSSPCIALIDVTNRCNLACPICFANASAKGYVVEPTLDELRTIMTHFRSIKPIPPVLLQLSGGEPTVRDDFVEIVRMGKELGFVEIMLTTNGLKLAARNGPQYIKDLMAAGLNAIYLSFDSADDPEVYRKARGVNLLPQKKRVIENCRKAGFKGVMLVPTIAKGVSDHQVGPIMEFAKANRDVVSGVVFQPVSLCGRIDNEQIRELRYTTSDLSKAIGEAVGITNNYIYPIPATSNLTKLIAWYDYSSQFTMASHPDCGFATVMSIDTKTGKWMRVEDWFDVDGLLKWGDKVWDDFVCKNQWPTFSEKLIGPLAKLFGEKVGNVINQASDFAYRKAIKAYFMGGAMRYLKGISGPVSDFIPIMLSPGLETAASFFEHGNNLLISSMHFQDVYNFDIERVQRCLVHYGMMDPDRPGDVLQVPFCAFNSIHRENVEKRIAVQNVKLDANEITAKAKEFLEKEVGN